MSVKDRDRTYAPKAGPKSPGFERRSLLRTDVDPDKETAELKRVLEKDARQLRADKALASIRISLARNAPALRGAEFLFERYVEGPEDPDGDPLRFALDEFHKWYQSKITIPEMRRARYAFKEEFGLHHRK